MDFLDQCAEGVAVREAPLVTLRFPKLIDIKADNFGRVQSDPGDCARWRVEHAFALGPGPAWSPRRPPSSGRTRWEARRRATIRLASRATGALELAVTDTGPGIPVEARERTFEPFFTMKATCAGLGLTIAQQIPREHRGEILVDSNVGNGTTLILRLRGAEEETAHDSFEDSRG